MDKVTSEFDPNKYHQRGAKIGGDVNQVGSDGFSARELRRTSVASTRKDDFMKRFASKIADLDARGFRTFVVDSREGIHFLMANHPKLMERNLTDDDREEFDVVSFVDGRADIGEYFAEDMRRLEAENREWRILVRGAVEATRDQTFYILVAPKKAEDIS